MLHGGDDYGSAGCIDVGPADLLMLMMIMAFDGGKQMTLKVDYSRGNRKAVPKGKWGHLFDDPWEKTVKRGGMTKGAF